MSSAEKTVAAQHDHLFGSTQVLAAERRTWWVVGLTLVMMVAEVVAGNMFGSMALLADGWHMATHAAALGITAFAYMFARRHAGDRRFSFGTGKVGALGGFGSAVSLAVVAALVAVESIQRFWSPQEILFDEAIAVAVIGLVVNLVSAWLLGGHEHASSGHEAAGGHQDANGHETGVGHASAERYQMAEGHGAKRHRAEHRDHNLRGAYLHVLADAVTSVCAIGALLVGRSFGWTWVDAATGLLGALLIGGWSVGLMRQAGGVLLDAEAQEDLRVEVSEALVADGQTSIVDLHLWSIGVGRTCALIAIVSTNPKPPEHYRALLKAIPELVHITVEVNPL